METSNLSYFPVPVNGEAVYSWLCRYHLWSGHNSFRKHSLAPFEVKNGQAAAEFPRFLRPLSQLTGVDIDWIITHMTDVAFYQPFLSSRQYCSLINSLKAGKTASLQSKLGMVANRLTPGKELYCCPKCVERDLEALGFPYWHVEHQILGLVSCPEHQTELVPLKKVRSQAILPSVNNIIGVDECINNFSNLIHDEYCFGLTLDKSKVIWTYLARLKDLELLTLGGQLRLHSLKKLVRTRLLYLSGYPPYQQLLSAIEKQYPECLFYNTKAQHHPIKQLFFIYVLFGTWKNFEQCYQSAKPLEHQNEVRLVTPNITLEQQARKQLEDGVSLRKVSASTGVSVTTLKILAQQQGIEIDTRPKKIFKLIERDIWRKLFIGGRCVDIARELGLSVGAVEQILQKHQYLKPLRKKIWFYRDQCKHRAQLKLYFEEYPHHTRKQFRVANSASYMWLYRHDKDWLEENLPEKVKRVYWPRRFSN